ncbi:MAG: AIR synthase family protein [Anaerolineae bacterium]|nr:AIR synthase family protein [Anaerolineae bacterium]
MTRLPVGKIPHDLLADLLTGLPTAHPRLVLGPQIGEDAAVIALPDRHLVAKTDPITFATDEIGWYAVQVCANDIATIGATPLWFLATVLLPEESATADLAQTIFAQIGAACRDLGVTVAGGHSEVTYGLNRPIVVGCMLGEVSPERTVRTGGARPGDAILLSKGAPVEAAAIIAREKRDELAGHFPEELLDRAAAFLHVPGISIVRDAAVAMSVDGVTSMHDPTEGGVVTALWELAEASQCGVQVSLYGEIQPWLPEAAALCRFFGLDPARAIASGALLLTVDPTHLPAMRDAYARAGIPVYHLGHMIAGPAGVYDVARGALERPLVDEITRLF